MKESPWVLALIVTFLVGSTTTDARAESNTDTTRSIVYRGIPVTVDLPLNQEIRVHLDESIVIGVPVALTSKLDVSSVHGIVYFTALQSFTPQRLALKGTRSGRFVLLDVSATPGSKTIKDIVIRTDGSTVEQGIQRALTPIQLVRYVAQTTLGPRRPDSLPAQLRHTSLVIPPDSIYRDFDVTSTLLAAWRTDHWLALAVELHNQSDHAIVLNPDNITGTWYAAGFQHARLLPRGKRGAQSVMFLVGAHEAIADLLQ